uniref:Cds6 C-terminal domain-containing protein n=1 Tax=Magnetococcus massalia (strain MO-1) TaxID=451514 RepID=A0A1S7LMJ8_MAGMO|nr:conserved exported protein of unknown function [ Include TPR repeat domains] [Candidatus Magnetococcus massalia]
MKRFTRFVFALPLLVGLAAAPQPAAAEDIEAQLDQIHRLVERQKLDQAATKLKKFLARYPKNLDARFLQGVILVEKGQRPQALQMFQELAQAFPRQPEPYNNLGVLYAQQGMIDMAREAFLQAIMSHPSYATAHRNLQAIYANMAAKAYGNALELSDSFEEQPELAMLKKTGARPLIVVERDEKAEKKLAALQGELEVLRKMQSQAEITLKQQELAEKRLLAESRKRSTAESSLADALKRATAAENELAQQMRELEKMQKQFDQRLQKMESEKKHSMATLQENQSGYEQALAALQKQKKEDRKTIEALSSQLQRNRTTITDLNGKLQQEREQLRSANQAVANANKMQQETVLAQKQLEERSNRLSKRIRELEREYRTLMAQQQAAPEPTKPKAQLTAAVTPEVIAVEQPHVKPPKVRDFSQPAIEAIARERQAQAAVTAQPKPTSEASVVAQAEEVAQEPNQNWQTTVRETVEAWRAAWSDQNVEGYLAAYANRFRPPRGMSLKRWKRDRKYKLGRPAFIRISLDNIQMGIAHGNRIKVSFMQEYRSNTYRDKVRKVLLLEREAGSWKIVRELSDG